MSEQRERTFQEALAARHKAEVLAFENDQRAKAQAQLDFWWEQKLLARAMARREEIPERGEYNPFSPDRMRR